MSETDCRPPDPGGGVCCQQLGSQLRHDFEERFKQMEAGLAAAHEQMEAGLAAAHEINLQELRELVAQREEIVLAKEIEIAKKDEEITELKTQIDALKRKSDHQVRNKEPKSKTEKPVQKKSNKTKTAQNPHRLDMDIFKSETFPRFYQVKFDCENTKRSICPFKFELELIKKIDEISQPIQSSGRDGFLIEVSSKQQGETLLTVNTLCDHSCRVLKHDFFNVNKGLIYVYNNEVNDLESFKGGLGSQFSITDIVPATWIKPKNDKAKALLVSFGQDTLPEYVHIPGEYQETKVYPYKDRPMQCNICQKYGHVASRCSASQPTCGNCGGRHNNKDCEQDESHCCLCGGAHTTKSKECPVRKEEEKVMEIQKRMKIGKAAARAFLGGETLNNNTEEQEYVKYINVQLNEGDRRKTCPYKSQKFLKEKLNVTDTQLTVSKTGYIIKSITEQQTRKLIETKNIAGMTCSVMEHKTYNESKGLIYLNDVPTENEDYFTQKLITRFDLKEASPAKWIKISNPNTKPYLLTFNKPKPPAVLSIPGQILKVSEYKPRPLFCTKCLMYGHSKNRCDKPQLCRNCTKTHDATRCSAPPACRYCEGAHRTGDKACPTEIENRKICDIQYEQKVSWVRAKHIYKPPTSGRSTFAEVTSRPVTSRPVASGHVASTSKTEKKRDRQSESDEDIHQDRKAQKMASTNSPTSEKLNMSFEDDQTSENNMILRQQAEDEFETY